tara:strand:- start:3014 stop:4006 length:993 start_codon:yes stop_codon:yes gene_type:complete
MKKILIFVAIALVQSCGIKVKGQDGMAVKSTIQAKEISKEIATPAGVREIVSFLASDELQGRASGSEGIGEAATYIAKAFKANGVTPYFVSYKDTLTNFKKELGVAYNVVGFVEGNDPELKKEFLILGAHYDHIGKAKANGEDVIANGANDNASGTATVMELARYFGTAKTNKRSLIFALFSAEEMGLLGSKHLAEKLKTSNLNLYAMLNFEMVGIPMQDKDYLAYVTGYDLSNLAAISNTYAGEKIAGFLPKAGEFRLFMRSDNHPFHTVFNVPSQTYSTFDFTNFEHYHKVGDEAQLMDYEHMAKLINKFVPVIEGIANAATKEISYK